MANPYWMDRIDQPEHEGYILSQDKFTRFEKGSGLKLTNSRLKVLTGQVPKIRMRILLSLWNQIDGS
jgi:hypothetical protein